MLKEKVDLLLNDAFQERPDLFLVSCDIGAGNEIKVVIDGDESVKVADCIFVSRAVEHNLDREEIDFSLEVTSAGVGKPLVHQRQYLKNVGRDLELTDLSKEKQIGKLVLATDEAVTIEWQAREPKAIGKGKETVQKQWSLEYKNIKQAKVVITFN
jgi:ribosome maturation factor RimP